jgi:hypothetical protein
MKMFISTREVLVDKLNTQRLDNRTLSSGLNIFADSSIISAHSRLLNRVKTSAVSGRIIFQAAFLLSTYPDRLEAVPLAFPRNFSALAEAASPAI